MPKRPHGGDEPAPARPQVRGGYGAAGSMRQAEDAVAEVSRAGRPGTGRAEVAGGAAGRGRQSDDLVTHKTGLLGGTPEGPLTRIKPDDDAATGRSIEMENSGAATLAGQGWNVKQNPTRDEVARSRQETGDTGDPEKNPDYLIEGRVFDCYSPTNPVKPARGIWSEVADKVIEKRQTQRAVVNLEDWRGSLATLREQFANWPIVGLKEVKVITSEGEIVQIDLPATQD